MESGEALWQQEGAASVGEEAEVAAADEALGEPVKQEATEKLIAREGQLSAHCGRQSHASER